MLTRTPRYSIVVVTYNSSADIVRCLDSVKAHTSDYEIIVVDNASKDSTKQILNSYQGIKTILNDDNRGFTAATNQGIRAATGRYVIFLNPDTEVFPLWADHMAEKMENEKDVGGVGPMSTNCISYQSIYDQFPQLAKLPPAVVAQKMLENGGQCRDTPVLIGFCFMTSMDILIHVGLLDERLFLGNDDLEFSWRLRIKGYRLVVSMDSFVAHEMQKSFDTVPKETTKKLVEESTDELYRKLVRRYGRKQLPDSSSLWAINWFNPSEKVKAEQIDGPETRHRIMVVYSASPTSFNKEWERELCRFYDITVSDGNDDASEYDALVWLDSEGGELSFDPDKIKIPIIAIATGIYLDFEHQSNVLSQFDYAIVHDYNLYRFMRENGVENVEHLLIAGCITVDSRNNSVVQAFDVTCLSNNGDVLKALATISDKRKVFLGCATDADDLRSVIAQSKIVVEPNREISEKSIEAMAHEKLLLMPAGSQNGCPIATFEHGSHYVEYNNTNDLLKKIDYYLERENDRKRIGEAAKIIAVSRFSYQALVFRMGAILREALSLTTSGRCNRKKINSEKTENSKIELYEHALELKKRSDFQTAKRTFESVLNVRIESKSSTKLDSLSHFHIADIYLKENNVMECGGHLVQISDDAIDNAVLLLFAKFSFNSSDIQNAQKYLQMMERTGDISPLVDLEAARLYVQMCKKNEACATILRGVDSLQIAVRTNMLSDIELMNISKDYAVALNEICPDYPKFDSCDFRVKNDDGMWLPFKRFSSCLSNSPYEEVDLNSNVNGEKRIKELKSQGRSISLKFRNAQSFPFIEALSNGQYKSFIPMSGNVVAEYTPAAAENLLSRSGYELVELKSEPVKENWLAMRNHEVVRAGRVMFKRLDYTNEEWSRFFMESCELLGRPRIYKDVSQLKVSIVILTFNQMEYTAKCLESIRNNTEPGTYEIIIVDNASKDGTAEWLKREKSEGKIHHLVLNSENKGVSAGWNQGMRLATGEYVLIFNNDTIVPKNWLRNMLRCAESRKDIGMVGPMSNSISGLQCEKDCGYTSMHEFSEFSEKYMSEREGNWWELFRIVGFCMLIKRKVIDEVGEFDERFGKGNFEDDDYCLRVRRAGYRIVVAGDSFIHHFGGVSFAQTGVDWKEQMHKNQILFKAKWDKIDAELMALRSGTDTSRYMEEAEKHIESGDYPSAIHLLLMIIEKEPKNARAYNNLGVIAWQKGNVNDGEHFFKEALKCKSDFEDAIINLSDAYRLRGALAENKELLQKSQELLPDSKDIAERLAEDNIANSADVAPSNGSMLLIAEADSFLQAGSNKEAEERYAMVLSKEPENSAALNGIGLCAWYAGNHENAYWFFRKAVETAPSDEDTLINFTDAALVTGRADEAEKVLNRALSLNPRLKEVSRMLLDIKGTKQSSTEFAPIIAARELNLQGEKLISEGLVDKAEEKFREILIHLPDHFVALNNMALCDWYRGDIEKAYEGFLKSLEKSPAYEDALINLFDAALKLKRVREVVPYLERAISINPSLRDTHDILNQIKLRGDRIYDLKYFGQIGTGSELNEEGHRLLEELKFGEATAKFIEHIEKHGDSCDSYCGLGIVQFYRGEYEDAFRLFSHAVELNPLSEDALLNLYDASCKINMVEKGKAALQNALDIDPGMEKIRQLLLRIR